MSLRGIVEDILNIDFDNDGELIDDKTWRSNIPNNDIVADLILTLMNNERFSYDYEEVGELSCDYIFSIDDFEVEIACDLVGDRYIIEVRGKY